MATAAGQAPPSSKLVKTVINGEELQGEEQALAALARQATVVDVNKVMEGEPPIEIDESTGIPKEIRSYIVHEEPRISLIPNFVCEHEIKHLLELAEQHWIPSTVGAGVYKTNNESKDLTNKQSVNRTSYSCMLKPGETSVVAEVEHRLSRLAGMPVEYLERLNMVRYEPGQFFNKHHDGRFRPITVFLYLNDLPDGDNGETFFPELGLKFKPAKGCAIMWSNIVGHQQEDMRTVHQGLPPKSVMKYGVNCFFNEKPMKVVEGENVRKDTATEYLVDPEVLVQNHREKLAAKGEDPSPGNKIVAFCVMPDPKLTVIPHLLLKEETAALISLACGDASPSIGSDREDLFARMQTRIASVAGRPVEHMEPMRLSKLEPFMLPDGHNSGSYVEKYGSKTVFIFLNDADGGELYFPRLGVKIQPREGAAVIWSAARKDSKEEDLRVAHQGQAPDKGVRYAVTCVFRDDVTT